MSIFGPFGRSSKVHCKKHQMSADPIRIRRRHQHVAAQAYTHYRAHGSADASARQMSGDAWERAAAGRL
ncbi:hypothetical protein NGB36_25575 [Streptomyces sp. RB6PN25]|uniref:Uncharacterized protein n=1 Tax=Streptomyces humicola TaxID=2953240 RepID=A0ABT1Q1R4_9ACTN|nr:hypothetical protein [Streptomyces humicola]MCQ4083868.1 hypothetical protein [Streptomyces humicola]